MKKKAIIIGVITLASLVLGLGLYSKGIIRFGMPKTEYPVLEKGEYRVANLNIDTGKYAIYAKKGSGKVIVNDKEYLLSDEVSKKAEKELGGIKNSLVYEDSPKVELNQDSQIKVETENFEVSFMKK